MRTNLQDVKSSANDLTCVKEKRSYKKIKIKALMSKIEK